MNNKPIPHREFLAYKAELKNGLFRQIHRRLRQLRETGFNQKIMAERLGMDEGQLSRCLRGDTDLRLETLADLARALGCRITTSLIPLHPPASYVIEQSYDDAIEQPEKEPSWSAEILERT